MPIQQFFSYIMVRTS